MTLERSATICNRRGLHARATAKFVKALDAFDADIRVRKAGSSEEVSGRSIMGLMMLGAGIGTHIELLGDGPQAEAALDRLVALIEARFDEED